MSTTMKSKLMNLQNAKDLYECRMLDDKNYIRTVNKILEKK